MITESDAKKFQLLYQEETGERISLEEAFACVESLAEMIRLVYRPIKCKNSGQCTRRTSDI